MEVPDRPLWLDATCDRCASFLVLADSLDPEKDPEEYWLDEWECPTCLDGIHMDWPPDEVTRLQKSMDDADFALVVGERKKCGCIYVDGKLEITRLNCLLHGFHPWTDWWVWRAVFK